MVHEPQYIKKGGREGYIIIATATDDVSPLKSSPAKVSNTQRRHTKDNTTVVSGATGYPLTSLGLGTLTILEESKSVLGPSRQSLQECYHTFSGAQKPNLYT